jgi:hypothetical protein
MVMDHPGGERSFIHYLGANARLMLGIVAMIQTSGSRLNFHPHIHVLIIEGGIDREGSFYKVCSFHDDSICELFGREVFAFLLERQLINRDLIHKILISDH